MTAAPIKPLRPVLIDRHGDVWSEQESPGAPVGWHCLTEHLPMHTDAALSARGPARPAVLAIVNDPLAEGIRAIIADQEAS
jgi:hypothetical protein